MEDQNFSSLAIHEHKIALEAIFELLKEKNIITDKEFTEKIATIAKKERKNINQ